MKTFSRDRLLGMLTGFKKRAHDVWVTRKNSFMMTSGFGSFTVAGWGVDWKLGCVVMGVSFLILNFLTEGSKP